MLHLWFTNELLCRCLYENAYDCVVESLAQFHFFLAWCSVLVCVCWDEREEMVR
jgi:hypothetical protein